MQTESFLYDDLAFDDSRRLAGRKATAAALARCKMRFGAFLAGNRDEVAVRYDFISDDVRQVVADVAAEYGGNAEQIFDSVTTVLAAGGFCDECKKWKSGPKKGCECSGDSKATPETAGADIAEDEPEAAKEKDDKNPFGKDSGWHGEWRFVGEALKTETLPDPKFGTEPWSHGPSPKMDKTRWKPNALNDSGNVKPIDTDMKGTRHPTEHQDIGQIADHTKNFQDQTKAGEKEETLKGTDGDAGFNTDKNQTQYPTRTFNDTHHVQDAVTHDVWPAHNKSAGGSCPGCGSNPNSETRCSVCKGWDSARTSAGFGDSADAYPTPSGQFKDAPNLDAQGNPGYSMQNDGDQPGNTGTDPNNTTCQNCGEDIHHHDEQGMCPTDVHMPLDPSAQYPPAEGDPATHMQSPGFQQGGADAHWGSVHTAANCELCEEPTKGDNRVVDGLRLCRDCRGADTDNESTSDEPQTSELERNSAVDPDKNPVLDLLSQEQIQQALAAFRPR